MERIFTQGDTTWITYDVEEVFELRNVRCIPNTIAELVQMGSREGGDNGRHKAKFPYDEPDKLYIWSEYYRGTLAVGQSMYVNNNIIEIMKPIYNNGTPFTKPWKVVIEYKSVSKDDINLNSRMVDATANGMSSSTGYRSGSICNLLRLNHMFIKPVITLRPTEFLAFEITGIVFKCYVPILEYFNVSFYLDNGKCKLGIGANNQYDMDNMKVKLVKFNVSFNKLNCEYVKSDYDVEFRYFNIDISNYKNNELVFANNGDNIAALYSDNALKLIYPYCVNLLLDNQKLLNLVNGCETKKVNYNVSLGDVMGQFSFLYIGCNIKMQADYIDLEVDTKDGYRIQFLDNGAMRCNHLQVITTYQFPTRMDVVDFVFHNPAMNNVNTCASIELRGGLVIQLNVELNGHYPQPCLDMEYDANKRLVHTPNINTHGRVASRNGIFIDITIGELANGADNTMRCSPLQFGVGHWTAKFRLYFD